MLADFREALRQLRKAPGVNTVEGKLEEIEAVKQRLSSLDGKRVVA